METVSNFYKCAKCGKELLPFNVRNTKRIPGHASMVLRCLDGHANEISNGKNITKNETCH